MDRDQHPGRAARQRGAHGVGIDGGAPFTPHPRDLGAVSLGDLAAQQAEAAALGDDDAIAGLGEGRDGGLQPRAARARNRKRAGILGLEYEARERHDLLHDRGEVRVELAEQRCGHRPQHARIRHARAGTEENPRSQEQLGYLGVHDASF